ncbi:MAG TPA: rhodanese-like domain-containing protein [Methylocella sp.]|nr:rhodanese-like domain-containing protein [Methylocella sp.]
MKLLNAIIPQALRFAAAMALFFLVGSAQAEVLEPEGYWTGPLHAEVPNSLSGARVIGTSELAALIETRNPVLIDAASAPRRPDNLAPGAVWMPLPHENIPGSIWIPGAGEAKLTPEFETFFKNRLTAVTANDPEREIVFYCHPQCWASWNAAKRAMSYGYRNVIWYREGAEGWREAGHALVQAKPEGPAQ